jgi:hypothetical protein
MEGRTQDYGGIGWAVKQMLNGQPMRRLAWNASGPEYVAYVPAGAVQIPQKFGAGNDTGPWLVAKLRSKGLVSWTATHADLMASDWQIAATAAMQDRGSQTQEQTSLQPTET